MAVLFDSRFLYGIGTTTHHWRRQGKTRVHFSNIFSPSVKLLLIYQWPFGIPEQLAEEKTIESNKKHKLV